MKTPKQLYNIGKFTVRFEWTYKLYLEDFYIGYVRENKLNFSFDIKLETQENLIPLLLNYFEQCKNRRIDELILEEKEINNLNDRINESIHNA